MTAEESERAAFEAFVNNYMPDWTPSGRDCFRAGVAYGRKEAFEEAAGIVEEMHSASAQNSTLANALRQQGVGGAALDSETYRRVAGYVHYVTDFQKAAAAIRKAGEEER